MPFSPFHFLLFFALAAFLVAFVHVGALTIAFEKLGLSEGSALALFLVSLVGSAINLPLFSVSAEPPPEGSIPPQLRRLLRIQARPFLGRTLIAVNVGGALVPVMFSSYLMGHAALDPITVAIAVSVVATLSYVISRPIPGLGIGMPVFVAPLAAAFVAVLLDGDQSAPLAYISGTVGVLIGADVLRLNDIKRMGTPVASIGGAGTFDGIFITGIVAVLLA